MRRLSGKPGSIQPNCPGPVLRSRVTVAAPFEHVGTSLEEVMTDVEQLFGLKLPGSEGSNKNGGLVLTDYEYSLIKTAYDA